MNGFLPVLMRSVHILSAITLLGGAIFWRFGLEANSTVPVKWRSLAYASITGLLMSGLYNYFNKIAAGGLPKIYHSIFGVKFLLVLHVFAVGLLLTRASNPKRHRQLTGLVASGLVIVVLSAVLRYVSAR